MLDTWYSRELPVLQAAVAAFERDLGKLLPRGVGFAVIALNSTEASNRTTVGSSEARRLARSAAAPSKHMTQRPWSGGGAQRKGRRRREAAAGLLRAECAK